MEESIRTTPIHYALNRPRLFWGCDRELVMMSGVIAAAMVFNVFTWTAAITGLVFWFLAVAVLRLMAKKDPLLRHCYLRYLKYQKFYPARSTPWRVYAENTKMRLGKDPWVRKL